MTAVRRTLLLGASLLVALVATEAASRAYYWHRLGVSPWVRPGDLVYAYYPELAQATRSRGAAAQPRVLLLGASVLNRTFSDIAPLLQDALAEQWGRDVRVVNLAQKGHASLDSRYKYEQLAGERFDLVLVYHGINDLRANNVPPASWRDDYGHYAWYAELNFYFGHDRLRRLPLLAPFVLQHAGTTFARALWRERFVPEHAPDPEWVAYGAEIRTAPVFRRHLERIVTLAGKRGDPVMVMTFAHHLPPDYTRERFLRHELGYGTWRGSTPSPVEIWGAPEHVRAGLAAHDAVLRALAAAHPEALFVDQQARLGADPANFVDVCHVSPAGAALFVDGVMDAVRARGLQPRATGRKAA